MSPWMVPRSIWVCSRSIASRLGLSVTSPMACHGLIDVCEVALPVSQVSSAGFGGPDLSTLYITTARENFTPANLAAEPHAGDIFACTPGVTGRPPYLFGA